MTTTTRPSSRWEVFRALAVLAERPVDRVADALSLPTPLDPADHTQVFAFTALPYASVYLGSAGMLGGETAARVAGFWEAVGQTPPDPPDHLTALLGLYATLGEQEESCSEAASRALLGQARRALLWEHVLPWAGVFVDLVGGAGTEPWDRWADMLGGVLDEAGEEGGDSLSDLPRHLQDAPAPLGAGFEPAELLVPMRTGMVVTRSDLVGAARRLGLGVRLTGRLPTLQTLLDQAPTGTLEWLSGHARRWERIHRERGGPAVVDLFWVERAANTTAILDAMLAGA